MNGFISSIKITEFGLALNVHLKTACLLSQGFTTLAAMAKTLFRGDLSNLQLSDLREINKIVKHVKIFTNHSRSKIAYTVDRIILDTPQRYSFEQRDGTRTTIAQYFQTTYNKRLEALPLVQTSGKKRFLPMELCYLVDKQFLSMSKMDRTIQQELLSKSTHHPNVYFERTRKIVEKVSSLNPQLQNAFGLKSIAPKPVQLSGRVLPTARMAGNNYRFYQPGVVPSKWGLFCFDEKAPEAGVSAFAKAIADKAKQLGLNLATQPNPICNVKVASKEQLGNIFLNLRNKTNAELIFVGIPERELGKFSLTFTLTYRNNFRAQHRPAVGDVQPDKAPLRPEPGHHQLLLQGRVHWQHQVRLLGQLYPQGQRQAEWSEHDHRSESHSE